MAPLHPFLSQRFHTSECMSPTMTSQAKSRSSVLPQILQSAHTEWCLFPCHLASHHCYERFVFWPLFQVQQPADDVYIEDTEAPPVQSTRFDAIAYTVDGYQAIKSPCITEDSPTVGVESIQLNQYRLLAGRNVIPVCSWHLYCSPPNHIRTQAALSASLQPPVCLCTVTQSLAEADAVAIQTFIGNDQPIDVNPRVDKEGAIVASVTYPADDAGSTNTDEHDAIIEAFLATLTEQIKPDAAHPAEEKATYHASPQKTIRHMMGGLPSLQTSQLHRHLLMHKVLQSSHQSLPQNVQKMEWHILQTTIVLPPQLLSSPGLSCTQTSSYGFGMEIDQCQRIVCNTTFFVDDHAKNSYRYHPGPRFHSPPVASVQRFAKGTNSLLAYGHKAGGGATSQIPLEANRPLCRATTSAVLKQSGINKTLLWCQSISTQALMEISKDGAVIDVDTDEKPLQSTTIIAENKAVICDTFLQSPNATTNPAAAQSADTDSAESAITEAFLASFPANIAVALVSASQNITFDPGGVFPYKDVAPTYTVLFKSCSSFACRGEY